MISKNTQKIYEKVARIIEALREEKRNDHTMLKRNQHNAVSLLYLHDLAHLIEISHHDLSLFQDQLEQWYIMKMKRGAQKARYFENMKRILDDERCAEHLKAILSRQ